MIIRCFNQIRSYYKYAPDGAVGRKTAKATLLKGKRDASKEMILAPFTSASELRVMLGLSYEGVMEVLRVRTYRGKYYWRDSEGREFESASRTKVLVPFDTAFRAVSKFGYEGKLLDVEPDCIEHNVNLPVPVVAVVGHVNHGKTTLLDSLRGTNEAAQEPGNITQRAKAFTVDVGPKSRCFHGPSNSAATTLLTRNLLLSPPSFSLCNMTFIDTPGHSSFDITRGRGIASADAALIVVSCEKGAELQTEEVLRFADKFDIPVVFALNKIDLPLTDPELVKQLLISQTSALYREGSLSKDYNQIAHQAVPISALESRNVSELVRRIQLTIHERLNAPSGSSQGHLPLTSVQPLSVTPGKAYEYRHINRRTDWHVGLLERPGGIGVIIDICRGGENGTMLTVLVKSGELAEGDYFVAGTAYGRITSVKHDLLKNDKGRVGEAILVTGLKRSSQNGDCAPDDLIIALSQARAHRLSSYRQRIAELNKLQSCGPPLEVSWQLDSSLINPLTQANTPRDKIPADELLASQQRTEEVNISIDESWLKSGTPDLRKVSILERQMSVDAARRLKEKQEPLKGIFVEPDSVSGNEVLEKMSKEQSHGRKSSKKKMKSESIPEPKPLMSAEDFAASGTLKIIQRWDKKDQDKARALADQKQIQSIEKEALSKVRAAIHGRTQNTGKLEKSDSISPENFNDNCLPQGKPVVPIILKTDSVALFDAILDELEILQDRYGISLPVVHGGIGNVNTADIYHAEVEKNYGLCPVYALGVSISGVASERASRSRIRIMSFGVFTEVLDHIANRCEAIKQKADQISSARNLKSYSNVRSNSGL